MTPRAFLRLTARWGYNAWRLRFGTPYHETEPKLRTAEVSVRWELARRFGRGSQRPHGLPCPLVVSLTSYPARFPTLALTLQSLLLQDTAADEVILWLGHGDIERLPADVRALEPHGLSIRGTEDLRSFTKLLPTLEARPGAAVITVDDDVYYPPGTVGELVAAVRPDRREVLCRRAHRIAVGADGSPRPYNDWSFEISDTAPSPLVFPTGVGGVLYMPGILHPDVTDRAFLDLCPRADDVWFYVMAARAGATFRKVGTSTAVTTWLGSQDGSLWSVNQLEDGNDPQIAAVIGRYGLPWPADVVSPART